MTRFTFKDKQVFIVSTEVTNLLEDIVTTKVDDYIPKKQMPETGTL